MSSSRIWTKSDWLIQEPEVSKMCVCEALAKEPPLRRMNNLKLFLVLSDNTKHQSLAFLYLAEREKFISFALR